MEMYMAFIWLFGGSFAPKYSALCAGQTMAISQNTALFSLLGTTYGGNGTTTFALPDLRGRVAIGQGQGPGLSLYTLGEVAGTESVTLISAQMPAHTHSIMASTSDATTIAPSNNYLALAKVGSGPNATSLKSYVSTPGTLNSLNIASASLTGGNQPFSIMQPYLALNYCIATAGIFPSRN